MRRPFVAVTVAVLILAAATAGGLVLAACGGSSDTSTEASASAAPGGGQMPDMSSMFAEALDPLVEDGTITSEQEDTVLEALTASMPSGGQGGGTPPEGGGQPSPGATPTGTPPSAKAQSGQGDMFSSALDELVDAGTITADQETAISEALSSVMQQGGPGQGGAQQSQGSSSAESL